MAARTTAYSMHEQVPIAPSLKFSERYSESGRASMTSGGAPGNRPPSPKRSFGGVRTSSNGGNWMEGEARQDAADDLPEPRSMRSLAGGRQRSLATDDMEPERQPTASFRRHPSPRQPRDDALVDDPESHRHGGYTNEGASTYDDEDDDEFEEEEEELGEEPLPPYPNDLEPIVPNDMLPPVPHGRFQWEKHPSARIVLALLQRRGVMLPRHTDLAEYHMAPAFLKCLEVLRVGSYFVKYAHAHSPPKERYVTLRLFPDENEVMRAYLCVLVHQKAVQLIDRVPLDDLVGISLDNKSRAFQKYMITNEIIKGSFVGQHRARLSARGAFSLWFFDREKKRPRSLDLLTTNTNTFTVWTGVMQGVISVNSVNLTMQNGAALMANMLATAQRRINDDGW